LKEKVDVKMVGIISLWRKAVYFALNFLRGRFMGLDCGVQVFTPSVYFFCKGYLKLIELDLN